MISEQIARKEMVIVENLPTKMTKRELVEYAQIVEERARVLQEQIDRTLNQIDTNGKDTSTEQAA